MCVDDDIQYTLDNGGASFVTFDDSELTITYSTDNANLAGIYTLILTGAITNSNSNPTSST